MLRHVGSETVVYDERADVAHSLTSSAATVFAACDGSTDPASLDLPGAVVDQALAELRDAGLLAGTTRRTLLTRGALVGAGALVVSVAAPVAAMAGTTPFGTSTPNTVLLLNGGGPTDGNYQAGAGYVSGSYDQSSTTSLIDTGTYADAPDQAILQTEQFGSSFTVTGTGLTPGGSYTVRLYLAEIYFGTAASAGGAGSRVFNVSVEGGSSQNGIDVYALAGGANKLLEIDLTGTASATGTLAVDFVGTTQNAKYNALAFF
jgi:hypothetical protein